MPITVGTLGRLRAVEQRGRDIVFSFESSDLVLTPLLPNVVRHTWVPTHWRLYTGRVTDSYAVPRRDWPAEPAVTLTETPETVRVQLGELLIEATRDPFQLRYAAAADGRVFLQEPEEGGLSWSYWEYALRYRLAAEDHFYGMGQARQLAERVDLDHRGHLREVWNQHSPPAATIFPALLSLRGYGLLIDNPHKATWDLGHTDPLTLEICRGAERSFTLYEDDGQTTRYRTGAYVLTPLQVTEHAGVLTFAAGEAQGNFPGYPSERTYVLNIHQQPAVREVTCNGVPIPSLDVRQSLELTASGWWWDHATEVLAIKLQGTARGLRVEVKG